MKHIESGLARGAAGSDVSTHHDFDDLLFVKRQRHVFSPVRQSKLPWVIVVVVSLSTLRYGRAA
jgi:hypothetical protein